MERFALSQFTTNLSFEEDLALCTRLGIPAIELCERKLSTDPRQAAAQLQAVPEAGLRVCSVQARVHSVFPDSMAAEPSDPQARFDAMRRTMDLVGGALPEEKPVYVLISGRAPNHDLAHAREVLFENAVRLSSEAAARGVRVAFEPLHSVMMNTDSFICTWSEAVTLAYAVGHESFGLVCDLWNVWDQPEILAHVWESIDSVALVHASDWRNGGPRRLNDRLVPGRGLIPFADWGEMLREAGYDRWVALEMLSDPTLPDSYLHESTADVIAESHRVLHAAGCLTPAWSDSAGVGRRP
ncbi:MAG TPA: sugar phosphate isomerase/epimerase family protein [Lacunisphaera sp.]|jgi:sugar phosphate isomerase/epimerase|nr:sugar phosphate isomerase/epimerase family protein [Lacunisphaera sp.]